MRFNKKIQEIGVVLLGQVGNLVISFLLIKLMSEKLNSIEFGKFSLGLTFSTLINQVIIGGLIAAASRFF